MRIYFIRHAQTAFNARKVHQPAEAPLSVCGIKQAHIVGRKLVGLGIDAIYSSPNKRARQSAEIVNQYLGKKITELYHVRENIRPSKVIGQKKDSAEAKKISRLFYEKAGDERWYHSDEENFCDLLGRAKRVTRYLSSRRQKNILVVTHSTFLKLLVCYMMHGEKLTPEIFYDFIKFFSTSNTGITMIERKKSRRWRLVTWNEHSHLRVAKETLEPECTTG